MWSAELSNVQTTSSVDLPARSDLRVSVVEWKFIELDTNDDQVVDRRELERLGRLVKKLVRPASCAATFHWRCDVNDDSRLTLTEWRSCFEDDAVEMSRSAVDGRLRI